MTAANDESHAGETWPSVQTSSSCSASDCTIHIELIPRLRFCRQLAERTLLELDALDPGDALLGIAASLEWAERYAACC